jgi:hypothetical protein
MTLDNWGSSPTGGLEIKGALVDLLDGGDPCQREKEGEAVGKVRIIARDWFG